MNYIIYLEAASKDGENLGSSTGTGIPPNDEFEELYGSNWKSRVTEIVLEEVTDDDFSALQTFLNGLNKLKKVEIKNSLLSTLPELPESVTELILDNCPNLAKKSSQTELNTPKLTLAEPRDNPAQRPGRLDT